MFSIIIPIYKNLENTQDLTSELSNLNQECQLKLQGDLEIILVDDGCPQKSGTAIYNSLRLQKIDCSLISHSRNFGSFSAIRTGFRYSKGDFLAVMAADLQEPPSLIFDFFQELKLGSYDIVIGTRQARQDPFFSRLSANLFWFLYRNLINRQIPQGGADVFACNRRFCTTLLALAESHTSLLGLIYWLGFRRKEISYIRQERTKGRSAWTIKKKLKYLSDSIYSFTDLPIFILLLFGLMGMLLALALTSVTIFGKFSGSIVIPGYSTTVILVTFFGGLNSLGLGVIGNYIHRTYENTKQRPDAIVLSVLTANEQ